MTSYIIRRLLLIGVVLTAVSMLVFGITSVLPANVAYLILGQFAAPEQVAALEAKLGLNDPVWLQYLRWAGGFLKGDLGTSMLMSRPIAPILTEAIIRSLTLALTSFVLIAILGIGLGVWAALRHGRTADHVISVGTYIGVAVPEFFWGIAMIMIFAAWLGWLPAAGYVPISDGFGLWLSHIIAPVITLVSGHLAHISRLTRSSMIETLQSPYVNAARAKGLPERIVVFRHALRNALLPTITVLAMDFGRLMGGIVVVETIFAFPGLGRLIIFSIQSRDLPTLQAAILVVAAIYAFANLLADLLYARLNPRIRLGRNAA